MVKKITSSGGHIITQTSVLVLWFQGAGLPESQMHQQKFETDWTIRTTCQAGEIPASTSYGGANDGVP